MKKNRGLIYMKLLFKNKTKYTKEVYKTFLEFHNKSDILKTCRYSSLVERQLPKLKRRVRFPLSACFYARVKNKLF